MDWRIVYGYNLKTYAVSLLYVIRRNRLENDSAINTGSWAYMHRGSHSDDSTVGLAWRVRVIRDSGTFRKPPLISERTIRIRDEGWWQRRRGGVGARRGGGTAAAYSCSERKCAENYDKRHGKITF